MAVNRFASAVGKVSRKLNVVTLASSKQSWDIWAVCYDWCLATHRHLYAFLALSPNFGPSHVSCMHAQTTNIKSSSTESMTL
ncbi:hypothetical protein IF2G_06357 [Cordyceps javanica]|nr:hypothetical protein IF2G_06357 [Cordyceps javanica]